MRHYPFVRQLRGTDCGPACLLMILLYYNREYTLSEIEEKFTLDKDGVSIRQLSDVSKSLGLQVFPEKGNITTFINSFNSPRIVLWDNSHYVVVYKIIKRQGIVKYIRVADPAKSITDYSLDEFISHWTIENSIGFFLDLIPSIEFKEVKKQKNIIKNKKSSFSLRKYLKNESFLLIILLLCLFFGSIIQIILPFLTQNIVDIGIGNSNIQLIWLVLLGELFLVFCKASFDYIRLKSLLFLGTRISISLISDFLNKLLCLPISFYEQHSSGDIIQRIDDHKRIERFFTINFISFIYSAFTFTAFTIILFYYGFIVVIIHLFLSLVYFIWTLRFLKKRKMIDYENFDLASQNKNTTYQMIDGIQEIKLQGCENKKQGEWERIQIDLFQNNLKSLNIQQLQSSGGLFLNEIKNILVIFWGATSVIDGNISIGMLIAILTIIAQLGGPLDQITMFLFSVQDIRNSVNRIKSIHKEKNEVSGNKVFPSLADSTISIRNVSFKYSPEKEYALKNLAFEIPQNKVTAIVGASGSGKTTLLKLILGFYQPQEGEIYVGGQNLSSFDLSWWRKRCGAVMQDGFIFNDSIANNIIIQPDEKTKIVSGKNRLYLAVKMSNLNTFIDTLPLKFQTLMGRNGQGISLGQKQRILISRIVYKDPQFVFLDEATNSLDANTEKCVTENLSNFYNGKTVVIVAHRLSTVKNADQIIVLDEGKIVEKGTHSSLIEGKGKYFELVKNQLELGL